ncbi:peptidoglycan DD-metalloendopeptidase family protein [Marinomonas sp. PE14-40]|uniref:peptidoglycan DD-metalloendopeptidase family protein n=1 Tax=Marinomonas sp. PE14-40 TaxID=3060621 RepID=UPI003F6721CB
MARTNLSKHLLLLAATTSIVALLVGFAPSEVEETTIKLEVPLQIISIDEEIVKTQVTDTEAPAVIGTQIGLPTPSGLVKHDPSYITQQASVKSGDSLSKILSSHGISNQDIYRVSSADKKPKELTRMRPGQQLEFVKDKNTDELISLKLIKNQLETIAFEKTDGKFVSSKVVREPETVNVYKEATISNSLFLDGLKAGISQSMLIEMANIFGWDIDFALDLRNGDTFSLLFEEKYLDGQSIGFGNILAAQFVNNGRVYQAIRYETNKGAHYYTPDGLSMRKTFLRTPVDFTRISSKFNPNRLHPIFKTTRPHRGVDYAASKGTPVKASGDGKVIFKGKQNGYGNVVILDHGRGYTTLYAHLNGFSRKIKRGGRVKQGQTIAFVGQTGYATGPHLHYEFRINGTHKNPVTVKLPNDEPMAKKDLKDYLPYAQTMASALESYHSPDYMQKLASIKR